MTEQEILLEVIDEIKHFIYEGIFSKWQLDNGISFTEANLQLIKVEDFLKAYYKSITKRAENSSTN